MREIKNYIAAVKDASKDILFEGVDQLLKHPFMKGLPVPKRKRVDQDGEVVDLLDYGAFRVGQDGGTYYIEDSKGKPVLTDLVMTQLAPAVSALIKMGV